MTAPFLSATLCTATYRAARSTRTLSGSVQIPPEDGIPAFGAVGIVASFGGLEALGEILSSLPATFCVPIFVVQHRPAVGVSRLREMLESRSALPVRDVCPGEIPEPGIVYLAPEDRHLIVERGGRLGLSAAPRVRFCRPAGDPLFETMATTFGPRAIGVVLTGLGNDGADGVLAIRRAGGVVLAQSPGTARGPGMPTAAIATGAVHFAYPVAALASVLVTLVMVPGSAGHFGIARVAVG